MAGPRRREIARERLDQALTEHLVADFAEHGAEVIARMRREKPVDYIKMVNSVLEKQVASDAALTPTIKVIERRIVREIDPNRYAPWRNNPDFEWPREKLPDASTAAD